ncbi:MAG: hypothetical protein HY303_12035 [Candidatus Wallbacteria bacterium]|nr:hypothetical protein [Candidatus Wallbacteria bacterium]
MASRRMRLLLTAVAAGVIAGSGIARAEEASGGCCAHRHGTTAAEDTVAPDALRQVTGHNHCSAKAGCSGKNGCCSKSGCSAKASCKAKSECKAKASCKGGNACKSNACSAKQECKSKSSCHSNS